MPKSLLSHIKRQISRRGTFFGQRSFLGGILALVLSLMMVELRDG